MAAAAATAAAVVATAAAAEDLRFGGCSEKLARFQTFLVVFGCSWTFLVVFGQFGSKIAETVNCRNCVELGLVHKLDCVCFVLFRSRVGDGCNSVGDQRIKVLQDARMIPAISQELHAFVAIPFQAGSFKRLGQMQAELRRHDW